MGDFHAMQRAVYSATPDPAACLLFGEFEAATPGFCDACNGYIGVGCRVFYDGAYRVCIPCAGLDKSDTTETGGPER